MEKVFMKGCEAVAEAAMRAGCRYYAGYPITPQNQVPEYMSRKMPKIGGIFMQGESEVASINMVYGAAAGGTRSMITSSSCGLSLMSETVGHLIAAQLPVVIVNFQRGGPGIGDIGPTQQDYFQATKAHANGGGRMLVMSPASLQETVDSIFEAFDKAEEYRSPVYIAIDGITGGMMESVIMPDAIDEETVKALKQKAKDEWSVGNKKGRERRQILGGDDSGLPLQNLDKKLYAKYQEMEKNEVKYENYLVEDAEYIITAYGIGSRFAREAVNVLREEGYKVGMVRPINIYPFPFEAYDALDYTQIKGILSTEMSIPPQFVHDVKIAVNGRAPISEYLTSGGVILDANEIVKSVKQMMK